jgi:thiol-disulfide isomerase/thioredoxin/plastocyanin
MKKSLLFFLFCPFFSFAQDFTGLWRLEMPTTMGLLPFHILIEKDNNGFKAFARNGEEKLSFDKIEIKGDSIIIRQDIFDAVIKAKVKGNTMTGTFTKRLANLTYRTAQITASKGNMVRFKTTSNVVKHNLNGNYEATFNDAGNEYPAVGIFKQIKNTVTGTFLTNTGDYRYLQGNIVGDSLKLSCFDGNHVFLFKAKIVNDNLLGGYFGYNIQGHETWEGKRNPNAKLPDAYSLTYLKPGFEKLSFSFKNVDGQMVSLTDEQFKNKVTIVQVLGTWCPNCMDETRYLSDFYKKNKQKNIAIVGLAFEKMDTEEFAFPKIKKIKERFGVEYPILLAGKNDKADASKKLPMLNKIISFPTTIIIDKKGKVRKIHTGFNGPATGAFYDKFKADFEKFVGQLEGEG